MPINLDREIAALEKQVSFIDKYIEDTQERINEAKLKREALLKSINILEESNQSNAS